ncbi:MAG: tetratricopeptide repeat protein [Patescibacteria group bacterium]
MYDIEHLEQQAIDAAMNLQWKQAIDLNNQIIKLDAKNESANLRLGFVYLQQKDIVKAKKYYSKALKLQPRNSVAISNLERIKVLEKAKMRKPGDAIISFDPDLFLEMAGKTKVVGLTNLGQKDILARLTIGEPVELKVKKRRVEVRTVNGDYIGTLPDDLSKRLMFFIKAKSIYVTYIKESTLTRVIVFIKEEKKGKAVYHQISFPQNIQKKLDDTILPTDDKEEIESEEQEEHMDAWEKMAQETPVSDDKELLIDIQSDDSDEEE